MHALSVSLLRAKQLPVITNGLGASPHAGSTCTIGVVTVRPLNRLPTRLYFKFKPDPNNTFFFIFTCTTQYPWVLANLNLSQAMAPPKKKRTHTVFRDSSAHRSASTSKPRFVGEKVKLGELISKAKVERCGDRSFPVYSMTMHDGIVEQSGRFKKTIASRDTSSYKVVKKNQLVVGFPIDEGVIYVQNHEQPGIMSPAYNVWDFDSDRILPAYLEFVLHSPQSMAYYAEKMRGTTARRRTLTGDALKNMPVPVPSIEDQYAVVKTLNCIKSQLAATQQMLDKLDQLVKSRFVEMFGDLKLNKYNWPIEPFESFAVIDTHMANNLDAYANKPHIGIDSIESNSGRLSGYRTVAEDGIISGKYPFTAQHIIYSKIRPALNKVALPDFDGVCSADAYPILPAKERCNRIYLAQVMRSSYFLDYVLPLSGRAQMPKVNKKALQGFSMPLPPLELQQEFAAFVAQVDKSRFVRDHEINFRWERFTLSWSTIA